MPATSPSPVPRGNISTDVVWESDASDRTLASGRFRLVRQLGAGGLGVVYEAQDTARQERVALKTLPHLDPHAISRLKHEFRALANVAHPNLVRLYELFSDGVEWFFTMELVEGIPFDALVRGETPKPIRDAERKTPSTDGQQDPSIAETLEVEVSRPRALPPQAAQVEPAAGKTSASGPQQAALEAALRQLVLGVCALHAAGKLHCDLKPSNVIVSPADGHLTILDFGLVVERREAPHERPSDRALVSGTPAYMAPEQAAGGPLSEATDWYAVGVMLYEALTGQLPFAGSASEILRGKQLLEPAPPASLLPEAELPDNLCRLCMQLLRREASERPTGAEILARLDTPADCEAAGSPTMSLDALIPPLNGGLYGREDALRQLQQGFSQSRTNTPLILRLHGPAGVGKSALLREFAQAAGRTSAVVLKGHCYEREVLPFKAMDGIMDALAAYLCEQPDGVVAGLLPRDVHSLSRLFPVLRRVRRIQAAPEPCQPLLDLHHLRRRAFAAVRELLAGISDRAPLLLLIDDAHWGDSDSAQLLLELLRPADGPRLMLVLSYRSDEAEHSPLLGRLKGGEHNARHRMQELALGPLSETAATQMVSALQKAYGRPGMVGPSEVAREARGNPFFATQLVHHMAVTGMPLLPVGWFDLQRVIGTRLQGLPQTARAALDLIAVAGHPISEATLRAATPGRPTRTAVDRALSLLRAQMWVRSRVSQQRVEFECYHDRIRESVVASLDAARLRAMHLNIARALERNPEARANHLASHYLAAGCSAEGARYAQLAAEQAASALAFDDAARLFRIALRKGDPGPAERSHLETRLGEVLAQAGHGLEAARSYLRAASQAEARRGLELRRRAAELFLISGHFDEGTRTLTGVLAEVGLDNFGSRKAVMGALVTRRAALRLRGLEFKRRQPTEVPRQALMRVDTGWSAATGFSIIDPLRGAGFQAQHLRLALATGEPYRVARALALESGHRALPGVSRRTAALTVANQALSLAHELDNAHAIGLATGMRGLVHYLTGAWTESLEDCDRAEQILLERCTGVLWELTSVRRFALSSLAFMGQLAELAQRVPVLLAEARERDNLFAASDLRMRGQVPCLLAQDKPERAREEVDIARRDWTRQGFHLQHYNYVLATVQCSLYEGNGAAALGALVTAWPQLERTHLLRIQGLRAEVTFARARATLAAWHAAPTGADGAVRKLAGQLEAEGALWAQGLAAVARAGLSARHGRVLAASRHLKAAVQLCDRSDMALQAAAARARLGRLLGGDEGMLYEQRAARFFEAQGVAKPDRLIALLTPGFED